MDKKLTDNEIIKALDEVELFLRNRVKDGQPIKLSEYDVGKLRNISQVCAKAYDEIDQLQTEKENLKVENQSLRSAANSLKMHYEEAQMEIERLRQNLNIELEKFATEYDDKIKAEAYKEFAERLKYFIIPQKADGYTREIILKRDIDNLLKELKEMVGENND